MPDTLEYWAYDVFRVVMRGPARLYWTLRVTGTEHVPARGPVLVAANHASYLDPWFLGGVFPRWPVRFLVNEPWYRRSRAWTRFFDANGSIPVRRGDPGATLEAVGRALAAGSAVGIFPEGKISPDGSLGRARAGLGYLAAATGVPVLPCAIVGNYRVLPRERLVPRPGRVTVRIGAPVHFPQAPVEAPDPREALRFSRDVLGRIREFLEAP